MTDLRVGCGYDVHPFKKGRKLFLGGISIPYKLGLSGHSDADVLIHSMCDAILGALSMGDIGMMFPNTDAKYKNIRSTTFLDKIRALLKKRGTKILNIDSVVLAEKPRIAPYAEIMKRSVAKRLGISKDTVSIKATTSEGLGFIGRGEGIACFSTVLIVRNKRNKKREAL